MDQPSQLGKLSLSLAEPLRKIGAATFDFLAFNGSFMLFTLQVYQRALTPPWKWRLFVEQAMEIGVKSFPIAMLTSVFVGMVMVLQTGVQLVKFGSKNYVPGLTFIANAREMVPAFCAIVVGARVAASITAQIGSMKVTEQIDAMDILNVDPLRYLAAPRVVAMTIMLPAICAICLVTGSVGGAVVGVAALNIDPLAYYTTTVQFALLSDIFGGISKCIVFGNVIALVGCYYGFHTRGGAAGVGRATTNSVVLALVLILLFDYILTTLLLSVVGIDE